VKFAVVHFDWTSFPFSQALHQSIEEAVAPHAVSYAPPWFEGKDIRKLINSLTDSHPNAAGHRIEADRIAEFILAQGWFAPAPPG
jgi:hypothetical protein